MTDFKMVGVSSIGPRKRRSGCLTTKKGPRTADRTTEVNLLSVGKKGRVGSQWKSSENLCCLRRL